MACIIKVSIKKCYPLTTKNNGIHNATANTKSNDCNLNFAMKIEKYI